MARKKGFLDMIQEQEPGEDYKKLKRTAMKLTSQQREDEPKSQGAKPGFLDVIRRTSNSPTSQLKVPENRKSIKRGGFLAVIRELDPNEEK